MVGPKNKNVFQIFKTLHRIFIFKTKHHPPHKYGLLCNLFPRVHFYDFFINCIFFLFVCLRIVFIWALAGAEWVSNTQTLAHSHPADHSRDPMDKEKPGLQESCKYFPEQLNSPAPSQRNCRICLVLFC